ncbi:centrosomal protein of 192 kDa [Rhinophrynus dorsalis]
MTERFSKIEDETFPSFLGESINSNISETLENCTLASNLGLPVAASTVAKSRPGFERPPDSQESYLENVHVIPEYASSLKQSGTDLNGKYALSFKDDLEPFDTVIGMKCVKPQVRNKDVSDNGPSHSQVTIKSLPHEVQNDFSSNLCTLPRSNQKSKSANTSRLYRDAKIESRDRLEGEFSTNVSSFLENEKLVSIASLDGSSSDDLDDEEFYDDDQLEAYFKKLLPPGMQRGVIEGQEISDPKRVSYMAFSGNPIKESIQAAERLQFLEDFEEDFQMLNVRLAATGMDSAPGSDDEDVELELEEAAQQQLQREHFLERTARHLIGEQDRPSFRPGLEGGSSEDESSNETLTAVGSATESACRESAEGHVLSSPIDSPVQGFPKRVQIILMVQLAALPAILATSFVGNDLVKRFMKAISKVEPTIIEALSFCAELNFVSILLDRDGSSGSDDGVQLIQNSDIQTVGAWDADLDTRNVAGEENVNLPQLRATKQVFNLEVQKSFVDQHSVTRYADRQSSSALRISPPTFLPVAPGKQDDVNKGLSLGFLKVQTLALSVFSQRHIMLPDVKNTVIRVDPVGNRATAKESKANSSPERNKTFNNNLMQDFKVNCELSCDTDVEQKLDSLYFRSGDSINSQSASSYKRDADNGIRLSQMFSSTLGVGPCEKYPVGGEIKSPNFCSPSGEGVNRLADAYLSPCQRSQKDCPDTSATWQCVQEQPFLWSFGPSGNGGDVSPPHSVVYQNEEGKWVTDLAYYKSFANEQGIGFSGTDNEDGFVVGTDALAMIKEDQEEFEREHKFIQEEKMDLDNLSLNISDTSWKMPTSSNALLKASQVTADLCQEDASYLRLSLGEFFGQRSEALGCLGGGQDVKRPSFGYHITSPQKQEPFALLRESDFSVDSEHEDTIKLHDNTLTPEDLECLPDDKKLASATFDVRAPENKADGVRHVGEIQIDHQKSNVEVVGKGAVKELFCDEKPEQTSESMLLSISTIASAIANASCNADPSQLAAMIMALSNKNRKINSDPMSSEPYEVSITNQMLRSHVDMLNPECAAVDMERYLKVTDLCGRESEAESFAHSVKDFTWDMSIRYKQTLQDSVGDLANITDVQKQDLRKPENTKEIQQNVSLQPTLVSNQPASNTGSSDNSLGVTSASGSLPTVSRHSMMMNSTEVSEANHTSGRTSENRKASDGNSSRQKEKEKLIEIGTSTSSKAPPKRNSKALQSKAKPSHVNTQKNGNQVPNYKHRQRENCTLGKSDLPNSTNILKSPRGSNSRLTNESKCHPAANESKKTCEVASQKHVSFQPCPNGENQKNTESKDFTDNIVQGFEEEQYSFRPSTSPLIHSSPSQDSLKLPEQGLSPEESGLCPSLSRLTYISATENTLQNTTIPHSRNQSHNTIELSTTIVRSSPTPIEMHSPKTDKLFWQQNTSQMSGDSPQKPRKHLSGFNKAGPDSFNDNKEMSLKQHDKLGQEGPFDYNEKTNAVNSGLTSDGLNYFRAPPVQADTLFPWQEFVSKSSQGLSSANVISGSGLGNYPLMQKITDDHQFVPVPCFKPVLAAPEAKNLPTSVPTLLTGQLLSNIPYAQQYLGNMTSVGSTSRPPYAVGNSALYGTHAGFPSSTVQTQNIQNAVAGIPPSINVGSGLLATLPISNNRFSDRQNILSGGYPGPSVDTNEIPQWGARMSSGFGQVLVPEELTFPSACCVGIASQASLNIFNPNERWLQVNIGILNVAVNGEKVDTAAYQCLVFKNKTIIGPRATEDLKILFLPQKSGLFQCMLSVSSWPVSADAETIVRSEAIAAKVFLTAVSESPLIEVDTGKIDSLDFGDVPFGSWKTLPLKLFNRTHATVPIRLIISANATAWRCFTFSKEPSSLAAEYALQMDMSKMSSPSVISHVMHASYDGQDPEYLIIWVVFRAHQTYVSTGTGSLGPAEEFVARVDVEVDSPGPACILKSIPLRARAGCARIHAPKDLQTIHLFCDVGSTSKQLLPLKNAGNISVHLKIKSCNPDSSFTVEPEDLFIVPLEEQVVSVKFSPQSSKPEKSILKIMVLPSGPQYEVALQGETEMSRDKKSRNPPVFNSADVPPILSNKQFISWAGVALGRAVQQKLILRNTSTSASQHLRLVIRGQDQDCFQLHNTFGLEERLTSNRELTIRPKEDASIHLMFSPTRVGSMLAKLEIKQSGIKSSQPGIKFTIPLSGYGGTSNLILEDVKKLSDSYVVTLNGISSGKISTVSFCIRNTGSRAAYVKSVCFADFNSNVTMDPNVLSVNPEKFVLKERSHEIIRVSCNATRREEILCQSSTALLSTVCLFYGDEVSRQQYRRALLHKPEMAQKVMSESNLLKNTRFDEEFPDEQQISEAYDLPQRPNDIQLFYGNMKKIIISVVGNAKDRSTGGDSLQPYLRGNLESSLENTEANTGNTSLDVLPVKGPQGPHLSCNEPSLDSKSKQTWSIYPEHLHLTAQSISAVSGTGHIKLINNSTKLLQFELSWPAHCLTITPQHGSIEPKSHIIILVSPNPSMATKQSLLPWNGQIYVHCDNGQKFIKVQISEASTPTPNMSAPSGAPRTFAMISPLSETPVHIAKPLPKSPSAKVEIKNRTLVFPKTASGESSETFLDIENPGNEDVKWLLSSFAPPYVKGVDQSGDVYRATYTAFRCSRVSGVLAAHEKLKVAIHFFPRDKGDYTQFWDLECHPISEPHLKHKVRFQLCGEGIKDENLSEKSSIDSIIKTEVPVKPRRRSGSEASTLKALRDETARGVYASEELYTFPPTVVGDSSTLKVNLQNNSFTTYMLKFVSPREPFHMKHSKYSLRAHHYINLPVKFKPSSTGRFEGLLVVQTDTGNISIQLVGEALAK